MRPFRTHTGIVAPLDRANVDTDQIIPKQFLKRVERTGFGDFLFYDWRYDADGKPQPEFVLNDPGYASASILVAGRNFGCGSSREHAAWALLDYGFRAIIAPSFADIFANNCFSNGILTVELDESVIQRMIERAARGAPYSLTVDLSNQQVRGDDDLSAAFEIDPFRRECLMTGLDQIGLTLQHEALIAAHEVGMPHWLRR